MYSLANILPKWLVRIIVHTATLVWVLALLLFYFKWHFYNYEIQFQQHVHNLIGGAIVFLGVIGIIALSFINVGIYIDDVGYTSGKAKKRREERMIRNQVREEKRRQYRLMKEQEGYEPVSRLELHVARLQSEFASDRIDIYQFEKNLSMLLENENANS